jgi:hypothetical protein
MISNSLKNRLGVALVTLSFLLVTAVLGLLVFDLVAKGAGSLTWSFLTEILWLQFTRRANLERGSGASSST